MIHMSGTTSSSEKQDSSFPTNHIWNPQKVFFWYSIPGIYQVYTFPIDIPGIYLVYLHNMISEQNLVFIHSNTYIASMSMCSLSVQYDSVAG